MKCFYNGNCKLENTADCSERCLRRIEIDFLLRHSFIPQAKQKRFEFDLSGSDSKVYERLMNIGTYIEDFVQQGENLIIHSPNTGNGKTTWAIQLLLAYFDKKWYLNGLKPRGYFIHVPTMLSKWKDTFSNEDESFSEFKQRVYDIDLIVLDDLGAYKMSEFDVNLISSIVDQRLLNEKSIITTTNLDKKALGAIVGERTVDRLYSNSCIAKFTSTGFRGKTL